MKKKLFLNSTTSLTLQFVSILIGLILPRMMIQYYGSTVNGLISSVAQFISYITLFEAGMGGVVKAALYKPIANNEMFKISTILKATDKYFKKLSIYFVIYVLLLAFIYPLVVDETFSLPYTATLIIIISVSTFAQYFIGITYSIFLQADAKNYIINVIQIFSLILNAVVTIVLITSGASIHQVKLFSAFVFVLKPIILMVYVSKQYLIVKNCKADYFSLNQRKNGLAHHIAWFLHTNTDVVVITIFGELRAVSVYSVYYMIVSSITKIASSFVNGVEPILGREMVEADQGSVRREFDIYCMVMNTIVIILFFTAGAMLIPFVSLYTRKIVDADYIAPVFGYCLLAAEGVYCLRIPYHSIVTAAGHFKQTQASAIIETSINIILSVLFIHVFGLAGIAFATFAAMLYGTIYYIYYLSKNILLISIWNNYIRNFVCIVVVFIGVWIKEMFFSLEISNYTAWIQQSFVCVVVGCFMAFAYDICFFRNDMHYILKMILAKKR